MQIESTRFGMLEVREDTVLTFPDGLIGLPGTRYALLAQTEKTPFYWLHSCDYADVAVPVTTPWLFFSNYEVEIPDDEAGRLGIVESNQAEIFCVVRANAELKNFTINLAGPVIVNTDTRKGRQIINGATGYSVRQPLFAEVELNEVEAEAAPSSVTVPALATG
jgi:flagellar assembly factor FliW